MSGGAGAGAQTLNLLGIRRVECVDLMGITAGTVLVLQNRP